MTTDPSSSSSSFGDWIELKGKDLLYQATPPAYPEGIELSREDDEEAPGRGESVLIDFTARGPYSREEDGHRSGTDSSVLPPVVQKAKDWLVKLGEPDLLVPALDTVLLHMRAGQTANVWSTGQYAVPGKRVYKDHTLPADYAAVMYTVTLTKVVKDTSQFNPYFSIQTALTRKNIANDLYQCEWNVLASRERCVRLYEKAAADMKKLLYEGVYFQNIAEADHPQRKQCTAIMLDCLNNVTAVYMRWKAWKRAAAAAAAVLKLDKNNVKAHLRAVKIAMNDPAVSLAQSDKVLTAAEDAITYRDREYKELQDFRTKWKQQKKKLVMEKKEKEAAAAPAAAAASSSSSSTKTEQQKQFTKRFQELRKEGMDTVAAMKQTREELIGTTEDDNNETSASSQVAAMFGMS